MKILLLLTLVFGGTGTTKWNQNCSKALDVSPCLNCNSMFSVKCISGDDFYTCEKVTSICGDSNPPPGSNTRCRQDNPGNACTQFQDE